MCEYLCVSVRHASRNMADTRPTALQQCVNRIAIEQHYENFEIIINEIFSGGANYTSKLYNVTIKEHNKDDLKLFAKVATIGKKIRTQVPVLIFDTEHFAYTKLQKTYRALEEQYGVPEEHKIQFTKCYGCNPCLYRETVVLENLAAQGYGSYNRFEPVSWEYASAAVQELAKLHALSIAYSENYPKEFEKVIVNIKMKWTEESQNSMLHGTVESALKNVRPEYKDALKDFLEINMKDLFNRMVSTKRRVIIIHGDYRGSNLMHRVREDGKVDIKILDLQTLQGGSPVTDLLYFIFTGSDEQFRRQYYDELIAHYYTQFCEAMKRLDLNPEEFYSREDFYSELEEKLPFGLTLAVFTLPIVTVDAENAPQVNEEMELNSFSVENTSALYAERLNGVINDYINWGILKIE